MQPICLPLQRRLRKLKLDNQMTFVVGWGSTAFRNSILTHSFNLKMQFISKIIFFIDEPPSNILMEVQLPVVPQSNCAEAYRSFEHLKIDQSVICAGLKTGGKDACRVINELLIFYICDA